MKTQQTIENKILVVAAAHDFRSGMRSMLESAGYEVLSRQSVERTTQLLEVSELTMIVSDFELEDGNYFDLLKAIKESDTYYSETPIYCIGEKTSAEECVKTLDAGADEYSSKPLNRKTFLARTAKIVRTIKKAKNNPVTLELRVDPGEIPGVFQFLEAETKTGYLKANCKKNKGEVIFKEGKIVSAETEYCAAQDALTEILSWPFCHLKFIEENVEGDFDISLNVSSSLMDCVFEVDEFKEVLENYPDFEISFVQGDKPLPKNSNRVAKKVHRMASSGTILEELLDSIKINRRHLITLIHQLVKMGHLKQAELPFSNYLEEQKVQQAKSAMMFGRSIPGVIEALESMNFTNVKELDTITINPIDNSDMVTLPRLMIAGNNPELNDIFFKTLHKIAGNSMGKKGSIKSDRSHEAHTDLVFANNAIVHLQKLPPKLDDHYLKQLSENFRENTAVFFVISGLDRDTSRKNRKYLKRIRDYFKGAFYLVVPNLNPENPSIFIDCKHCFHKLSVGIDQSGSLGSCPICNTENVIPECLEYTADCLNLDPEVPCVFMSPADPEECRDLMTLSCVSLLNSLPEPA